MLLFDRQIAAGPDDGPARRPLEKSHIDQRIDDKSAVIGAERPQAHRLGQRQLETRHLHELTANPIDDSSKAHGVTWEQPPRHFAPRTQFLRFVWELGSDPG